MIVKEIGTRDRRDDRAERSRETHDKYYYMDARYREKHDNNKPCGIFHLDKSYLTIGKTRCPRGMRGQREARRGDPRDSVAICLFPSLIVSLIE